MRKIFVLLAWIVDANGAFHILDGYPKTFDSKNYDDDINKTMLRAKGDFHNTIGAMCKVDTRKIQSIILMDETNTILDSFVNGDFGDE